MEQQSPTFDPAVLAELNKIISSLPYERIDLRKLSYLFRRAYTLQTIKLLKERSYQNFAEWSVTAMLCEAYDPELANWMAGASDILLEMHEDELAPFINFSEAYEVSFLRLAKEVGCPPILNKLIQEHWEDTKETGRFTPMY